MFKILELEGADLDRASLENKMISEVMLASQDQLLETGVVNSMQFIVKDNKILLSPSKWESKEEKIALAYQASLLAYLVKADFIILITEAWFLEAKFDSEEKEEEQKLRDTLEHKYSGQISEHPDAKESLMLLIYYGDGSSKLASSEIHRAGPNQTPYTEDFDWKDERYSFEINLYFPWKNSKTQRSLEEHIKKLPKPLFEAITDSLSVFRS